MKHASLPLLARRQFITLLGSAAAALPVAAAAQESGERMRRIGFLLSIAQNDPVTQEYLSALVQGLTPLGWHEGRNVQIETRLAGGEATRIRALATELVSLAPDVIIAHGTETSRIMQQESRTIPIVFTTVTDPVGSGLVASLARPGGNITGFTNFEFSMAGKWLEFLKEAAPDLKNVTIIFNPNNAAMPGQLQAIAAAARSLGLQIIEGKVHDRAEIERVISGLLGASNAGLLVLPEFLTTVHRDLIIALATRLRMPAVYGHRYFTESGGFISYGVDNKAVYRRAASYVDRILRGEQTASLPVQQPIKFELVINLKAARAMGMDVAPTLLARADEVIE